MMYESCAMYGCDLRVGCGYDSESDDSVGCDCVGWSDLHAYVGRRCPLNLVHWCTLYNTKHYITGLRNYSTDMVGNCIQVMNVPMDIKYNISTKVVNVQQ